MQELIDRLVNKAGLSESQALNALETIKDFVVEKFPMMEGAIDKLFNSGGTATEDDGY